MCWYFSLSPRKTYKTSRKTMYYMLGIFLDLIHVCMIPSRNCVRTLSVIQRSFLFGRNQCFSIKLKSDEFHCQVWGLVFKFIFYDFWTFPSQLSFLGMAHPRARNWCIALPVLEAQYFFVTHADPIDTRTTCMNHKPHLLTACWYEVSQPLFLRNTRMIILLNLDRLYVKIRQIPILSGPNCRLLNFHQTDVKTVKLKSELTRSLG